MRPSLSHVAALLALGAALMAVPGVPVARVSARDGAGRIATRGGSYRLDASEAILHPIDGEAPDSTVAADSGLLTGHRPDGDHSPAVTPGRAPQASLASAPSTFARAADGPQAVGRYLRPPGRASPLA
jgi:hypothetical protein